MKKGGNDQIAGKIKPLDVVIGRKGVGGVSTVDCEASFDDDDAKGCVTRVMVS